MIASVDCLFIKVVKENERPTRFDAFNIRYTAKIVIKYPKLQLETPFLASIAIIQRYLEDIHA